MQNIVLKISIILTFMLCYFFDTFSLTNTVYGHWNRTLQYFFVL